jgi:ubiquinol-cytochrome c reductase iron-sulfur subunit
MTTTDEPIPSSSEETDLLEESAVDERPAFDEGEPTSGPWHRSHFFIPPTGPWPDDVPKDQDLTWWRYRDDPKGARRAELRIVACWMITLLSGLGLAVTYIVASFQSQVIGAFLACGFAGLGAGLVLWARDLLPGHEVTAHREHQGGSGDTARAEVVESLNRAIDPMARRPFLLKVLLPVGGVFGLAAFFPLASLGPRPHKSLYSSGWYAGAHLVTEDGSRLKPADLEVNGILTVFPEEKTPATDASAPPQSATVLINLGGAPFVIEKGREGWTVNGIVAFSKICTHAGCPVSLYDVESHQLVCPCHQSTFDVLLDCKPVFGPASRSLPQLALSVDDAGYLIAQGDYDQPVGPGFWNR